MALAMRKEPTATEGRTRRQTGAQSPDGDVVEDRTTLPTHMLLPPAG